MSDDSSPVSRPQRDRRGRLVRGTPSLNPAGPGRGYKWKRTRARIEAQKEEMAKMAPHAIAVIREALASPKLRRRLMAAREVLTLSDMEFQKIMDQIQPDEPEDRPMIPDDLRRAIEKDERSLRDPQGPESEQ